MSMTDTLSEAPLPSSSQSQGVKAKEKIAWGLSTYAILLLVACVIFSFCAASVLGVCLTLFSVFFGCISIFHHFADFEKMELDPTVLDGMSDRRRVAFSSVMILLSVGSGWLAVLFIYPEVIASAPTDIGEYLAWFAKLPATKADEVTSVSVYRCFALAGAAGFSFPTFLPLLVNLINASNLALAKRLGGSSSDSSSKPAP